MKDKEFIDTNVLVYAKLEDENSKEKRRAAITVIQQIQGCPVTSIQVLNEFANVLIKHHVPNETIQHALQEIVQDSIVIPLDVDLLWKAWRIREKYLFSYWDSMIVAAALYAGCEILYSEDLQHEQLIENQVKIINPFQKIKTSGPLKPRSI